MCGRLVFCCLDDGDNYDDNNDGDCYTNYEAHLSKSGSQWAGRDRTEGITYLHVFPPLGEG